jgi:hypothetical protein
MAFIQARLLSSDSASPAHRPITCLSHRNYQPLIQSLIPHANSIGFSGTKKTSVYGRKISGIDPYLVVARSKATGINMWLLFQACFLSPGLIAAVDGPNA